jgi:hypothetical protein
VLSRCLGELRSWLAKHPRLAHEPNDVYARVERLLRQIRRFEAPEDRRRLLLELELLVRDHGPLDDAFLPSLEDLHAAVTSPQPA